MLSKRELITVGLFYIKNNKVELNTNFMDITPTDWKEKFQEELIISNGKSEPSFLDFFEMYSKEKEFNFENFVAFLKNKINYFDEELTLNIMILEEDMPRLLSLQEFYDFLVKGEAS